MLQLTETHFEYGGVSSRQYGLMFANVDTTRNLSLTGAVTSSNIFSKKEARRFFTGDLYEDSPFSIDVEIVTDDGCMIDAQKMRAIEKWLFHSQSYKKLYFDSCDDRHGFTYEYSNGGIKRTYLNCRFINPERIDGIGGIYGYKATLEADSLLAWQDTTEITFNAPAGGFVGDNSLIHIVTDTDFKDYIYPRVTITVGTTGGSINIFNSSDSSERYTSIGSLDGNESIILDGRFNYVSPDSIYGRLGHKNFIRLMDGDNTISITGDVASIKFEWNNRRWL